MKIMKTYKIMFVAAGILSLSSCMNKLDLYPTNQFTEENYWTNSQKAQSFLNDAYHNMADAERYFYNEALSDNAVNLRGDIQGAASIASGVADPGHGRFSNEWFRRYQSVRNANMLLENIDKVPNMDEALKERMKAEARFIRAFAYFHLATWFGDVPLFSTVISFSDSKTISRSSHQQVISFVLSELDAIESILPVQYPQNERGKITKGAVIGMKARVHLLQSNWQQVIAETEKLIGSTANGAYSLFPSYAGLFEEANEFNSEVIFDFQYVQPDVSYNVFFDIAPLSVGARLNSLAPTKELVDSYLMMNGKRITDPASGYNENDPYVNRDPRLTATVVYHGYQWQRPDGSFKTIYTRPGTDPVRDENRNAADEYRPGSSSSPTGYYFRKYYDLNSGTNFRSGLNLIIIRYADILLMYAEAKNELGQMTEEVWNKTIRAIRQRAGFTAAEALNFNAALSNAQIREIIRNERRTELVLESLRIFDIKRWRIAGQVLNGWVHGAKFGPASVDNGYLRVQQRVFDPAKHYLWPIPRQERNINPNLTQNPNW